MAQTISFCSKDANHHLISFDRANPPDSILESAHNFLLTHSLSVEIMSKTIGDTTLTDYYLAAIAQEMQVPTINHYFPEPGSGATETLWSRLQRTLEEGVETQSEDVQKRCRQAKYILDGIIAGASVAVDREIRTERKEGIIPTKSIKANVEIFRQHLEWRRTRLPSFQALVDQAANCPPQGSLLYKRFQQWRFYYMHILAQTPLLSAFRDKEFYSDFLKGLVTMKQPEVDAKLKIMVGAWNHLARKHCISVIMNMLLSIILPEHKFDIEPYLIFTKDEEKDNGEYNYIRDLCQQYRPRPRALLPSSLSKGSSVRARTPFERRYARRVLAGSFS